MDGRQTTYRVIEVKKKEGKTIKEVGKGCRSSSCSPRS